ncbi:MAG: hypothetical protein ABEK02_01270 [Haloquadratum sp.]
MTASHSRPGSPASRRVALLGGLAVLAIVNYLDLVGVLGIGWTNERVGWLAAVWTLAVGVTLRPLEEMRERLSDLFAASLFVFGGVVVAVVTSPDVGTTYLFHATPIGQLLYATAPAVGNPVVILLVIYGANWSREWLSKYWHLRRTTPEERVLGQEDRQR